MDRETMRRNLGSSCSIWRKWLRLGAVAFLMTPYPRWVELSSLLKSQIPRPNVPVPPPRGQATCWQKKIEYNLDNTTRKDDRRSR